MQIVTVDTESFLTQALCEKPKRDTSETRMAVSVLEQDPNTKRFKRTQFTGTKLNIANF